MIVKIGDKIFKIQFEHFQFCQRGQNGARQSSCVIIRLEGDHRIICSKGECFCSPSDNFSKEIGRKTSLARALKGTFFSKADRAYIWECYRNRKAQHGLSVAKMQHSGWKHKTIKVPLENL